MENKCILYINEKWKDIDGYDGLYQISNCGRVKSLDYRHTGEEKILKQEKNVNGYMRVLLCKNGKRKKFSVHRLVAQAFLPNTDNLSQINHIDEIKTHNIVTNLEWCDNKYNSNYGTARERMTEKLTNRTDLSKPVLQIDKKTNEVIKEWPSAKEVERQLGFANQHISDCCLGKPKHNTAYGYKWSFKESAA